MEKQKKNNKLLNIWQSLTKGSMNRQIMGAFLIVGVSTGLVKFASVGKELLVAWKFGTGDELDAFLIAFVIPAFIMNVVSGSFQAALIPTYIKVREQQGKVPAQNLVASASVIALALLAAASVLMVLSSPFYLPVLASGFSPEKLALTTKLLSAIAPFLVISGLISIWSSVLNAGEKFALAALSPTATPIATVGLLFLLPNLGIFALALGLICGGSLELIILGIGLKKQKVPLLPKWTKFDRNLQAVVNQCAPVAAGAFLMCSTNLVDQSMAATLAPGSVSALSYADRIIALPLSLTTLALGTAVIPYFSKTIAQGEWTKVQHTFQYYLKLIFFTAVPLTLFLLFGSEFLVRTLFERGSFTSEDTIIVSQIQASYALQIPFYIASILVVRLVNSLGINQILAWGSAINLTVNIVANYLFLNIWGVKGIALSTSLVYLISFVFLYFFAQRNLTRYINADS